MPFFRIIFQMVFIKPVRSGSRRLLQCLDKIADTFYDIYWVLSSVWFAASLSFKMRHKYTRKTFNNNDWAPDTSHFFWLITQPALNCSNLTINARTRCEICCKLIWKTPEQRCSVVFIANFDHILHLALVFLLLTMNM